MADDGVSAMPLARAVRTYSWASTSRMHERVIRITIAPRARPSARLGKNSCLGLHRLDPEQDEALRGKPVEIQRREEDQEDAEPEARDRQHEQAEQADPDAARRGRGGGGEDAERKAGGQRDEQRDGRELKRDGEGGQDLGQDRAAASRTSGRDLPARLPAATPRSARARAGRARRAGASPRAAPGPRLLAHQDVDDVAGDQVEEQEREHRDARREHGDERRARSAAGSGTGASGAHYLRAGIGETRGRRAGSAPPAGAPDHLSSQVSLRPYRLTRFGL